MKNEGRKIKSFSHALVTGATSGIGEAFCHLLASKGIDLCISGRNPEKLQQLADILGRQVDVKPIKADLSKKDERQLVIDHIRKEAPELVVNNAGFGIYGEAIDSTVEEEVEILHVNTVIPLEISLEAARALIARNRQGTILNVASVASFFTFPNLVLYSAAKACVVHFSKGLDFELAPKGVRVLAACPGMVATDFGRRAARGKPQVKRQGVMTAEYAAEQLWWQVQKEKSVHVFDWKYRFGVFLSHFVPESLTARILQANIAKRIQN
jgi:short-subunit dehydrogenase